MRMKGSKAKLRFLLLQRFISRSKPDASASLLPSDYVRILQVFGWHCSLEAGLRLLNDPLNRLARYSLEVLSKSSLEFQHDTR
jgi:hypothetical protein